MSNLVNHAKRELELAGFPKEPHVEEGFAIDYDYEIAQGVVKMVELFASEGHSGMSASISLSMLQKLLNFDPLTPLTDDPAEWNQVDVDMWQSVRQSESFSKDGGKTFYTLKEKRTWVWHAIHWLPRPIYFWVWNHMTFLFYPIHTSVSSYVGSLDTASASR